VPPVVGQSSAGAQKFFRIVQYNRKESIHLRR
jgi:hypothetical protein